MGILYLVIGVVLILWGGFQLRKGFRPFRLRPLLLVALGALVIHNGLRIERYIP